MTVMEFINTAAHNKLIELVVLAIVFDTIFGVLRAIREKRFNSCAGIDGAIRKVGMLISLVFMLAIDQLIKVNLIGFIPETVRTQLGLNTVGVAEFFALLYIAYEIVSILKNMALCGLPVKKIWEKIREFLSNYTEELPDTEELDGDSTTGSVEEKPQQQEKVNTVSQGACGKKHRRRFFIPRKAGIEIMAEIMSEQTKEMTEQQRRELQEKVAAMSPEELRTFRNEQDADNMGFWGKECF